MTDNTTVPQTNRETCYFCGSEGPIQSHHIIPRRFDGGDAIRNLVDLCPTCHQRLERLYDDRFYAALGVGPTDHQVALINEAVADTLDELAESVELELSGAANTIREKFIRGDMGKNAKNAFDRLSDDRDASGTTAEQRERIRDIRRLIDDLDAVDTSGMTGVGIDEIHQHASEAGYDESLVDREIERLRQRGEVYEPTTDRLATT